ncbi:hypothetical protein RJ639_024343 [Escallonia herrerae]|uniref:Uncharacterized protein n=1 Tax=Escallonia herrerae TaxID=1293975 RepID=A0AA88UZY5_9ASTE|nr:hypothetical protein RJ639_024343 [Escallonia herrerae]
MAMLSTSVLTIKWTIKGKPKSFLASIGGDLIVKVISQFMLNQISGQVIEHEEFWDLSGSTSIAQAYFWMSRRLFSTVEAGKDAADSVKKLTSRISLEKENLEIFPDPTGDPTKSTFSGDTALTENCCLILPNLVCHFCAQCSSSSACAIHVVLMDSQLLETPFPFL